MGLLNFERKRIVSTLPIQPIGRYNPALRLQLEPSIVLAMDENLTILILVSTTSRCSRRGMIGQASAGFILYAVSHHNGGT